MPVYIYIYMDNMYMYIYRLCIDVNRLPKLLQGIMLCQQATVGLLGACQRWMKKVSKRSQQIWGDDGFWDLWWLLVSGGLQHTPLARALSGLGDPFYKEISIPDVRTERVVLSHRLRLDDPNTVAVDA